MPAAAQQHRQAIANRTLRASDRGIEIRFPHDRALVTTVRRIPGRRFDWQQKVWTAPLNSLPEAVDLLEDLAFDIPRELYDRLPALLEERERKAEESKARKAAQADAAKALDAHPGPVAFVPANDSLLTRRLKAAGMYRLVREETQIGDQIVKQTIGVKVPDSLLVKTLAELDRPTDPASRLTEVLRYLFKVDREARRLRPDSACTSYRVGKREHLLIEACRLAAQQDAYCWGWKRNAGAKSDAADWQLYFERDGEQVVFHSRRREAGPDFPGEWDQRQRVAFPWPPTQ